MYTSKPFLFILGPEKQAPPNPLQEHWPTYSEINDIQVLTEAQTFLDQEIANVKAMLLEADVEAKELKEKLATQEIQKKNK
jgi:hypothetical protein